VSTVLVTGAAGFIGHHVVEKLVETGYRVIALDNLVRASPRGIKVLRDLGLDLVTVDIRDLGGMKRLLEEYRPEAIVHAAALIDVYESTRLPDLYVDVNVRGTAVLLRASVEAGVSRFIYLSSAAVYGEPVCLPIDEEHPTNPLSPYGASKLGGEYLVKSMQRSVGKPDYVILRLFNVYGPGQDPASPYAGVISKFVSNATRGESLVIYGDGEQTRDFIHVDDVVEAIIRSLETEHINEVYNIGSGKSVKIKELAEVVKELAGRKELQLLYREPRPGDIKHSRANIEKALRKLNWRPRKDLKQGISELLETTT